MASKTLVRSQDSYRTINALVDPESQLIQLTQYATLRRILGHVPNVPHHAQFHRLGLRRNPRTSPIVSVTIVTDLLVSAFIVGAPSNLGTNISRFASTLKPEVSTVRAFTLVALLSIVSTGARPLDFFLISLLGGVLASVPLTLVVV